MNRLNLHDVLSKKSYDHAVICTYTFDPSFFEEYCLEKFRSLNENSNITVLIDKSIYESVILGPQEYRPTQANLRYLLHPINVTGVFHPKVFLFTKGKNGRLIIGSCNFTRPGLMGNAELAICVDFEEEKDAAFSSLFHAVYKYLCELCDKYPSSAFISNLQAMSRDSTWLIPGEHPPSDSDIEFLHNLRTPLWEQIISKVEPPVEEMYVLSRYFDHDPTVLYKVKEDLNPKKIKIFTQNGITTMTHNWVTNRLFDEGILEINLCEYKDEECFMDLHAKAIIIKSKDSYLLGFGSANFTSPAMFRTAMDGNVEIFLVVNGLSNDFIPEQLFDPGNTAVHLDNKEMLNSSYTGSDTYTSTSHGIHLGEATLVEDKIYISAVIPSGIDQNSVKVRLSFKEDSDMLWPVTTLEDNSIFSQVTSRGIQLINKASTLIRIEANQQDNGNPILSNTILITNLVDIHSGKNLRKERHIEEAQQSTVQFFNVLQELVNWGSESELLTFLKFCNIQVMEALRPILFSSGITREWDISRGMRNLGERNLFVFNNLHETAIQFVDRHINKLQQHVDYGSVNGIPNFIHIMLAIGGVISVQIERTIRGFEEKQEPLSIQEWYDFRQKYHEYFDKYRQLIDIFCFQYVRNMISTYGLDEVQKRFGPDIRDIQDMLRKVLTYREKIESLRTRKLKVKTDSGNLVIPKYFHWCILAEEQWIELKNEIGDGILVVNKLSV